ncbi:DUF1192 domain-containing protein [Woodsholea maritima]|uniref:DUF1192 domain-containing protein n=1 Tax=Woodsholea maritima TaxID=240237 RepID=UPI0009FEB636|nr:DUF1192 domain-containing protein [Woodsholea maritima]
MLVQGGECMVFHDDAPKPKMDALSAHADLSQWSVAALEERLDLLNAEIERTQAMILKKKASQSAAEAVFKRA